MKQKGLTLEVLLENTKEAQLIWRVAKKNLPCTFKKLQVLFFKDIVQTAVLHLWLCMYILGFLCVCNI